MTTQPLNAIEQMAEDAKARVTQFIEQEKNKLKQEIQSSFENLALKVDTGTLGAKKPRKVPL